jgi:hypothetical protein
VLHVTVTGLHTQIDATEIGHADWGICGRGHTEWIVCVGDGEFKGNGVLGSEEKKVF